MQHPVSPRSGTYQTHSDERYEHLPSGCVRGLSAFSVSVKAVSVSVKAVTAESLFEKFQ